MTNCTNCMDVNILQRLTKVEDACTRFAETTKDLSDSLKEHMGNEEAAYKVQDNRMRNIEKEIVTSFKERDEKYISIDSATNEVELSVAYNN